MTTTNLFVELIVIGVGATAWIVLLILSLFGIDWVPLAALTNPAALVPELSLVYLIGIVVDRLSDLLLRPRANRIRARIFEQPQDFQRARAAVYRDSSLRDLFEYARTRLRICRSWAINATLLLATSNIYVWTRVPDDGPQWKLSLAVTGFFALLSAGCFVSWRMLCEVEARNLRDQAAALNVRHV